MGAKSLTLWFYGQPNNDANEKMYVKLTDGDTPAHTAKVVYSGDMNDIRVKSWHEWNIALQKFVDACSVLNLANVKTITIGFGDGTTRGAGRVYFEDVQVYTTRCALVERDAAFAKLDYAPSASSGDCVIDYQEIAAMAAAWLDKDSIVSTKKPSDANLVVYYPLNEGDGNKVYPDPCNIKWTGTFYNSAITPPGNVGVSWASPGYDGNNAPDVNHCIYVDGSQGSRVQCGTTYGDLALGIGPTPPEVNAMTLSVWAKWSGPRTWDSYLMAKGQGLMGKRGGWSEDTMIFTFWVSAISAADAGSFGLGHYSAGDTVTPDLVCPANMLTPYIGQWVHLAATFPHRAADPCDANSHAKLYLNGGEVRDGPWKFSHGPDPNIFFTIGQTQDQNADASCPASFYGYIDEVRVYNRALEPNEIAYLADLSPLDGSLWISIPSPAEVYSSEPNGLKVINFKDFAMVVKRWLDEEMFPR
jgi:hypothetical protein